MTLFRIGVRYFRSIGDSPVEIDLTKKINILIGPNNAGKSAVLCFLEQFGAQKLQWKFLRETDRFQRREMQHTGFVFEGQWSGNWKSNRPAPSDRWRFETAEGAKSFVLTPYDQMEVGQILKLLHAITGGQFNSPPSERQVREKAVPEIATVVLRNWAQDFPPVVVIPAFRRIEQGDAYAIAGPGIIDLLSRWRSPAVGKDTDYDKFHRVQDFLRRLTRLPDAELEVPPEQQEIVVRRKDLRLPLTSYGTGLHQLIVLAIAVLNHEGALICMEEPEVHLHPRLQRELLSFLIEETNNRYVIATHSPSFLSRPGQCHIVRLWTEEGVTRSEQVTTTDQALSILRDLGVSPADVMQTRFAIWVEGPSDAIYLRRWIKLAFEADLINRELSEGVDFSIMFYGGRLLSHISLARDEDAIEHLVDLLKINQNAAIIMDSDRRSTDTAINQTKKRIVEECEATRSLAWVTEGREIENYLPATAIAEGLKTKFPSIGKIKLGRFGKIGTAVGKALGSGAIPGKDPYSLNKVGWSKAIAPHIRSIGILDLQDRLRDLVQAIDSAHD